MRSMLLPLALATLLCACSGGLRSDAPPNQIYLLRVTHASELAADSGPLPAGATVQVTQPLAHPGLASDRIVLVQPDRRLGFYARSRWAAQLPEVVEMLLVERLRSDGAWAAVHDSRSAFPADYALQLGIRRFEADYTAGGGTPQVRVVLDATLGRSSDRSVIASFAAEASAMAEENRLSAVVAAFEQAANAALDEVAERSHAAVRMSTAQSPP